MKNSAIAIKTMLLVHGLSQTRLAKELNVTLPMLCMVINGRRRSPRIEKALSEKLGVPQANLFPL